MFSIRHIRRSSGNTVTAAGEAGAILGAGTQTIVESRPFDYVGIVISPGEPGEAKSWFRLAPGVGRQAS